MTHHHARIVLASLATLLTLAPAVTAVEPAPLPIEPEELDVLTATQCFLLGSFDCVTWSASISAPFSCSTIWSSSCRVTVTVTADGFNWVTPGTATTSITGVCGDSDSRTVTGALTWSVSSSCTGTFTVAALLCGRASATARVTTPSGSPPSTNLQSEERCNPHKVAIYRDANWVGNNYRYYTGNDNDFTNDVYVNEVLTSNTIVNDQTSSVKMRSGCTVTLYEHIFQGGTSRTMTVNTASLGTFDNLASSLAVSCPPRPEA